MFDYRASVVACVVLHHSYITSIVNRIFSLQIEVYQSQHKQYLEHISGCPNHLRFPQLSTRSIFTQTDASNDGNASITRAASIDFNS